MAFSTFYILMFSCICALQNTYFDITMSKGNNCKLESPLIRWYSYIKRYICHCLTCEGAVRKHNLWENNPWSSTKSANILSREMHNYFVYNTESIFVKAIWIKEDKTTPRVFSLILYRNKYSCQYLKFPFCFLLFIFLFAFNQILFDPCAILAGTGPH